MVTPVNPLTLHEHGRVEQLLPGSARLAWDHPLVSQKPWLFKPADPKDTNTAARHMEALARAKRHAERMIVRAGGSPGRATRKAERLPSRPVRNWRLP